MRLTIGGLFAGYGGLDVGIGAVLDAEPVWFSEIEPGPSRILAERFPDLPNHGDIRTIDFSAVAPVDILAGGFPCQDVSHAGRRAGFTPDSRSGLWSHFARAIDALRPRLVVIENVRGLLTAPAVSNMEPDPWGVGDGPVRPVVDAFGAVLGDLADRGYDAEWLCLRAADVGAPHVRNRIFIVAHPTDADGITRNRPGDTASGETTRRGSRSDSGGSDRTHAGAGVPVTLLPTPNAYNSNDGETFDTWEARRQRVLATGINRNGMGMPLAIAATRLLATPTTQDGANTGGPSQFDRNSLPLNTEVLTVDPATWGEYAAAVERWESVIGRPAPSPVLFDGTGGRPRLSAVFVEWMMGLPAGYVTDVPISRNAMLRALGNGVVPQQAAAALRILLELER